MGIAFLLQGTALRRALVPKDVPKYRCFAAPDGQEKKMLPQCGFEVTSSGHHLPCMAREFILCIAQGLTDGNIENTRFIGNIYSNVLLHEKVKILLLNLKYFASKNSLFNLHYI
ncbi:hypothetical protein AB4Y96_00325 [Phyllobacterium sp. TAF24]|uniref:hypothetical protein n=1 Tax=Phyllobacterium sp. TAF24 TaxID=3233068 RepID=UPI003F96D7E2